MTVGLVAFHFPKADYRDQMIERVRKAAEVLSGVAGCLDVSCWSVEPTGAVVTTGRWESKEAFRAGFEAALNAGVDFAFDDREDKPRAVFNLTSV